MQPIEATFDLTYAGYTQAFRLHERHYPPARFYFGLFFRVLPAALGVCLLFLAIAARYGTADQLFWSAVTVCAALAWYLTAVSTRNWKLRAAFKAGLPNGATSYQFRLIFTDDAVSIALPTGISSRLEWRSIYRSVHNESWLLLYISKVRYQPLLCSAFTSAQHAEILSLVAAKVQLA